MERVKEARSNLLVQEIKLGKKTSHFTYLSYIIHGVQSTRTLLTEEGTIIKR